MSITPFAFSVSGSPAEARDQIAAASGTNPGFPTVAGEFVAQWLDGVPDDKTVSLAIQGQLGPWQDGQITGPVNFSVLGQII